MNHIDAAASYGDAELRIAPWMKRHRDRFFLATKTGERSYAGARDQIRKSLERLGVESVDLLQLHNLVKDDEWELAMGPDGALRAAIEARDAGLVRHIGVTGHGTRVAAMHLRSLERFDFDSVLLPMNPAGMRDARYAAEFEQLLARLRRTQRRRADDQGDRAPALAGRRAAVPRHLVRTAHRRRPTSSAPCTGRSRVPGVFVNSAGDLDLFGPTLRAARVLRERRAATRRSTPWNRAARSNRSSCEASRQAPERLDAPRSLP